METTTAKRTKYRHINAFAEKAGIHRISIYRALERDDPDTWVEYAEFVENKICNEKQAVQQAKRRVAQIQQPCTHA